MGTEHANDHPAVTLPLVEPIPRLAFRPSEARQALGISGRLLSTLIADRGSGIPIVRIGRAVLLPVAELRTWLADRVKEGQR